MKRLFTIAVLSAASAVALLPQAAAAQTRVQVTIHDHQPAYGQLRHERDARVRHYHPGHVYAPGPRYAYDGRYVPARRWVDRNRDGMDDRRGRRDLDRDGVADRYDRDLDNDGVANRYDRDMDGDGVRNRHDRRPGNRYAY